MKNLFNKLMENEEYRNLYEHLPNDERPVMMDAMKKLSKDFEEKILTPLQEMVLSGSFKMPEKSKND